MCTECQEKTVARVLSRREVSVELQTELLGTRRAQLTCEDEVGSALSSFYQRVRDEIAIHDPLEQEKHDQDRATLALVPFARRLIADHSDPLLAAVRIAAVGNMIDYTFGEEFDIEGALRDSLDMAFEMNDIDAFRSRLSAASLLVLCTDNAGEVVFDRVLLEAIQQWRRSVGLAPLEITVLVKGGPILNDALVADARLAGMDEVARIMDTGTDTIGILREHLSRAADELLMSADVIISKGMANFETAFEDDEFRRRAFFLLKAKCIPVATIIGVPLNSLVLAEGAAHDEWKRNLAGLDV